MHKECLSIPLTQEVNSCSKQIAFYSNGMAKCNTYVQPNLVNSYEHLQQEEGNWKKKTLHSFSTLETLNDRLKYVLWPNSNPHFTIVNTSIWYFKNPNREIELGVGWSKFSLWSLHRMARQWKSPEKVHQTSIYQLMLSHDVNINPQVSKHYYIPEK